MWIVSEQVACTCIKVNSVYWLIAGLVHQTESFYGWVKMKVATSVHVLRGWIIMTLTYYWCKMEDWCLKFSQLWQNILTSVGLIGTMLYWRSGFPEDANSRLWQPSNCLSHCTTRFVVLSKIPRRHADIYMQIVAAASVVADRLLLLFIVGVWTRCDYNDSVLIFHLFLLVVVTWNHCVVAVRFPGLFAE